MPYALLKMLAELLALVSSVLMTAGALTWLGRRLGTDAVDRLSHEGLGVVSVCLVGVVRALLDLLLSR